MANTEEVYHLEDSPLLSSINSNFLKKVERLSNLCNFEICGLLANEKIYFLRNSSPFPRETFYIKPEYYVNLLPNVNFIFHSHVLGSAKPSEPDLEISKEFGAKMIIYSVPKKNFSFYCPKAIS